MLAKKQVEQMSIRYRGHVAAWGAGLVAACAMLAPAARAQSGPEYALRGDAPTGSAIRSKLVTGGTLPMNKRYDEFTAEEKEALNRNYESIGPGDEPPFPANGLKSIYASLARAQQKLLVTGDFSLIATVDAEGNVTQVKALGDPDPEMTRVVATILTLTKFKPALCKGVPCKMDFPFRMRFSVKAG